MGIFKLADAMYTIERVIPGNCQYVQVVKELEQGFLNEIQEEHGKVDVLMKHETFLEFYAKIRYNQYMLITDLKGAEEITGYPFLAIKEAICTAKTQSKK